MRDLREHVAHQIAEGKKEQVELSDEHTLLHALIDNMPDAIYFKDAQSRFIRVNASHAQRMGLRDPKEAVGKTDFDFYPWKFARETYADEQKVVKTGKPLINKIEKITRPGRRIRWVSATKVPVVDKDGRVTGIVGISRDISEQMQMEEELRSSEDQLRILFEFAPDAYYLNDLKGTFIDGNRAAEEMVGYKKEELIGKSFLKLKLLPRSQIPKAAKLLAKNALGKSTGPDEFILNRKDGGKVAVEITTFPVKIKDQRLVLAIARNITERKRMEQELRRYSERLENLVEERTKKLKEAHDRLLQSERLAAIGKVASMVGHDLRNPLTGITGAVYYLKMKLGPKMDGKTGEMLALVEKNIEHSNDIINELLEYSREIPLEKKDASPRSIIGEALSLVEVPKNIEVLNRSQSEPKIVVDVEKMKRVFINLIRNAIDAMPEGGKLAIRSMETGDVLEIAFADTGTGMSKDILDKLWTPFFTTKAKGLGLGLPICKRIVEAHGGKISVESAVGRSTTFTVALPVKPENEGGEGM